MTTAALIIALATSAQAAPWPVTVARDLSPGQPFVTLYAPQPGATLTDMPTLQHTFVVQGQPERMDALGGLEHLAQDGVHLVAFDDGGAHYHDTVVLDDDSTIEPWSDARLRQESAALLRELELVACGPQWLELSGTGFVERFVIDTDGTERDIRQTHQAVTWEQVIDGLPSFGPGSETELLYGAGGALAAFSHAQRPLAAAGTVAVVSPRQAIARFLTEAEETGHWNHHKAAIGEVDHVELHDAVLGYWVPGRGESDGSPYQPVYEITGTIYGTDPLGAPTTVDLLWYQPATRGPLVTTDPALLGAAGLTR